MKLSAPDTQILNKNEIILNGVVVYQTVVVVKMNIYFNYYDYTKHFYTTLINMIHIVTRNQWLWNLNHTIAATFSNFSYQACYLMVFINHRFCNFEIHSTHSAVSHWKSCCNQSKGFLHLTHLILCIHNMETVLSKHSPPSSAFKVRSYR